jgi:hypothetical protein
MSTRLSTAALLMLCLNAAEESDIVVRKTGDILIENAGIGRGQRGARRQV